MGRHALQVMLDSVETAVLGCDAEGRPVMFNHSARALFGSLLDDTPVQQWLRLLDVTDTSSRPLRTANLSLLRGPDGEEIRDTEVVLTLPGGSPRFFRVHGGPVDDDGPVAAIVALHETTVQRRAASSKTASYSFPCCCPRRCRPTRRWLTRSSSSATC